MFNLINRVLVTSSPSENSIDVDQLLCKLNELGISGHQVKWSEVISNHSEPMIICTQRENTAAITSAYDNGSSNPYLIWNKELENKGRLYVANDKYETQMLSLTDGIYALIQTHIQNTPAFSQCNPMNWSGNMVGNSPEFKRMLKLLTKIAKIDCDVLIQGETGTGKELVARSIHYQSNRQDYPFVPVNCGAFNDDLLLSELFGHTKGAFTGANSNRMGLIEQAQNGTLFLDEVDSLSSKAQVAILRYLQDREIRPQGGNDLHKCDTRVLAASNKSLEKLVQQGDFREDLFFRLDVLHIDLPPLRNRGDDIHLLAQRFINQISNKYNRAPLVFSPNMVAILAEYQWPGNIRQLQNIVYRLCLLSDQFVIRTDFAAKLAGVDWKNYLPKNGRKKNPASMKEEKRRVIELFESDYLKEVLSETAGNISQAARIAKKERSSFIRLMKKYKIERSDFIDPDANNIGRSY
ncbi:MAG: sigma-54 dependent transcriptional regulator [Acidiferrobacterales bacterium]|nr:sigma-54 dependent transcriptional regulator [Acidiferrobacterales bacterium]